MIKARWLPSPVMDPALRVLQRVLVVILRDYLILFVRFDAWPE
jgi:hypothetical protein